MRACCSFGVVLELALQNALPSLASTDCHGFPLFLGKKFHRQTQPKEFGCKHNLKWQEVGYEGLICNRSHESPVCISYCAVQTV